MVQIHRFEGFYWVALTGGYARAARAFPYPITQPAVHQQVKRLEAELGVTLFERVAKDRMILTANGRMLHDFVAPFFEGLPEVLRRVRAGTEGAEIRLHAEPLLLRHLVPAWIHRLKLKRPNLDVILSELAEVDLDVLRRGDCDAFLAYLPEVPSDIAVETIATMRPFLVLPSGHPLAARKRVTLTKLAAETFISYHEELAAAALQRQALGRQGVHPERFIQTGSAETILALVEAGLGYSLVPSLDPEGPRWPGVTAHELKSPRMEFPVFLAWRRDMPEHPAFDDLLATAPST